MNEIIIDIYSFTLKFYARHTNTNRKLEINGISCIENLSVDSN